MAKFLAVKVKSFLVSIVFSHADVLKRTNSPPHKSLTSDVINPFKGDK